MSDYKLDPEIIMNLRKALLRAYFDLRMAEMIAKHSADKLKEAQDLVTRIEKQIELEQNGKEISP